MKETNDGRLNLVYFVPENGGFVKKNDFFDCCENDIIIKTFESIRHKVEEDYKEKGGVSKPKNAKT
jgi:hypothetical protein